MGYRGSQQEWVREKHRFPEGLPCCTAREMQISVILFSAGNVFRSLTMLTQIQSIYNKSFAMQLYDEAEQRTYRCYLTTFSICFKLKAPMCSEADTQPWPLLCPQEQDWNCPQHLHIDRKAKDSWQMAEPTGSLNAPAARGAWVLEIPSGFAGILAACQSCSLMLLFCYSVPLISNPKLPGEFSRARVLSFLTRCLSFTHFTGWLVGAKSLKWAHI